MVAPSRAPLRADRLRVLNAPRPVTVDLDGSDPVAVWLSASDRSVIDAILEVWRIDDEWWRQRIARRYVEAVLEGGARVVFFEDLATGHWFLQQA